MPEENGRELIWIKEAELKYNHAREWFTRRIEDGRLHSTQLRGSTRVYLYRDELEQYMKDHDKERN